MTRYEATSTNDWSKIPTGRGEQLEQKRGIEGDRYELWQAEVGDVIRITNQNQEGQDGSLIFDFTVVSSGEEPTVLIRQQNPDGSVIDSDEEAHLRGSGRWTDWRNNPMVRGTEPQLSITYGALFLGGETVVSRAETREHFVFGKSANIELIKPDYLSETNDKTFKTGESDT